MAGTPATPDGEETLGRFANLPGLPLEEIKGQRVNITKLEFERRPFRDDPDAPFALITLDSGEVYHTWSKHLIEKLEMIPADALPGVTTFKTVTTANKRQVWTLE